MKSKNSKKTKTNFQFFQLKKLKDTKSERSSLNLDLKSFHKKKHLKYNSGDLSEISDIKSQNKPISTMSSKQRKELNNFKFRDSFTSYKIKSHKNKIESKSKSKSPTYKTCLTTTNNETFFSNISNSIRNPEYDLMEKVFSYLGIDSMNYVKKMKSNKIDFNDMLLLTKEDLKEMQIPIGPRNRLLCFIENFNNYVNQSGIEKIDLKSINNYFQENKKFSHYKKFCPMVTSENLFIQHINNSQTINLKPKKCSSIPKNNNIDNNNNMNNININKKETNNNCKYNKLLMNENKNNKKNKNCNNNNYNTINNNNNHVIKDEIKNYLSCLNLSFSSNRSEKSNSKKKVEKSSKHPINLCLKNLSLDKFLISNKKNSNSKFKTLERERYKRKIGEIFIQKNKIKSNSKLKELVNKKDLFLEKNNPIDNNIKEIFKNKNILDKVENKEKKIFEKKKNKEKNIHKKNFSPKENINFLIQLQKEVNYKLNNDINSTREKELLLKLLEDTHKLNKFYENKE